jgi:hypothetical protein
VIFSPRLAAETATGRRLSPNAGGADSKNILFLNRHRRLGAPTELTHARFHPAAQCARVVPERSPLEGVGDAGCPMRRTARMFGRVICTSPQDGSEPNALSPQAPLNLSDLRVGRADRQLRFTVSRSIFMP